MRCYLIRAREKAGLSQSDAAVRLHISQNYLSNIESGKRQQDLKLSMLKGFSHVYNIRVDDLIAGELLYLNLMKKGE